MDPASSPWRQTAFVSLPGGNCRIPPNRKLHNVALAQRGLFAFVHKYGVFITIKQGAINTQGKLDQVLTIYREIYHENFENNVRHSDKFRTRLLFAVDPKLWKCMKDAEGQYEMRPDCSHLLETSDKFLNTEGDVFLYAKSDDKMQVDQMVEKIQDKLLGDFQPDDIHLTRSNEYGNTKILNGSFREGLANPNNHEQVNQHIVLGQNGNGKPGGAYMLTQKFKINWCKLHSQQMMSRENLIGRKMFDMSIIQCMNESSHARRAHRMDDFPPPCNVLKDKARIFRQSMPYGEVAGYPGREEGVVHVSIAQSTSVFQRILSSLAGHGEDSTADGLMEMLVAVEGSFWYVPNTNQLELFPKPEGICKVDIDVQWEIPRRNDYMFLNHRQYLHCVDMQTYKPGDAPSPRIIRLLQYIFEGWDNHWFEKVEVPDYPALHEVPLTEEEQALLKASVPLRRGLAIKKILGTVVTTSDILHNIEYPKMLYGWRADLFNIHPDEIIVGHVQRSTGLGLGKKTMAYLSDEEREKYFLMGLSEVSSVGHVIPDHARLLRLGVSGLLSTVKEKLSCKEVNSEQRDFLKSVELSLEGVQMYIHNFAKLAEFLASKTDEYCDEEITNLKAVADRMDHLSGPTGIPRNFTEAVQLIYSMHCCLHITGEPVSVGRLDVLLAHFIDKNRLTDESYIHDCQDVIDCFWVKFSERVLLDPHLASDNTEWGNCAVPFSSDGTFPRGDSINQWVQQVTVGGYYSSTVPAESAKLVTLLCLKAARRLPLIAPCLSLRVNQSMDENLLLEASKALLSGSAHHILPHDDRIVEALTRTPYIHPGNPKIPFPREEAIEYACDGCYEPMIVGKSQFAFTYIPLPKIVELTMNKGRTYVEAGPALLLGTPSSYRSKPADSILQFKTFQEIFLKHLKLQTDSAMCKLLQNYGNIWKACPSPLLSAVIDGCLETKRDLYNGGAKYNIAACMYIGFANCVDSLYAIERLCFDKKTACVTLAELLIALQNDWGFDIEEMVTDNNIDQMRLQEKTTYYQSLRERALNLPKFGTDKGAEEPRLHELATWLSDHVIETFNTSVTATSGPFHDIIARLREQYAPFEMLLCPGSGTFEGYVGWGLSLGASADGRRKRMPIASDFSATPSIQDGPVKDTTNDIYKSLASWNIESIKYGFSNGAEIDLNIPENFPEDELFQFLQNYANGLKDIGGNLLTLTCADRDRYIAAMKDPEKYDIVRVRMGGWTEHFVTMFDSHKKQHVRRPQYAPATTTSG